MRPIPLSSSKLLQDGTNSTDLELLTLKNHQHYDFCKIVGLFLVVALSNLKSDLPQLVEAFSFTQME
ncbi:21937_t:CDS:1, partial [Racocetra persica]